MQTSPQFSPTTQQQPPQRPGGGALLVGGLAFALVFLLIVGGTVVYLVLRGGGQGGAGGPTSPETSSIAESPSEDEPSSSETVPPPAEEERCWSSPRTERTSTNPSGMLRGGGLQFIPPATYDGRDLPPGVPFLNDAQGANAAAEATWVSTVWVGAVEWQPGVEYPGAEAASERIVDCLFRTSYLWESTSGRSLDDKVTEPVTISGMSGYRTTARLNWESSKLEKIHAVDLMVVVVDTPEGPSMFGADTAVGIASHEKAIEDAYDSLTGVS